MGFPEASFLRILTTDMQEQQIDISIIIVSWNVSEQLARCLASLTQQRGVRYEVFVIDNASADGSAQMVREKFPDVHLTANTQNLGFARANNQVLAATRGRHVLLLNPDTELPNGTLAQTVRYLDTHPDVGVLGCTIYHADGALQRSVLRFPTFLSQAMVLLKVQAFTQRPRPLRRYYALDFDYRKEADVDQIMGSFFAVRRSVFDDIGQLDNGYFLWFEEVDFCKRARTAGWIVRYTPDFAITHTGGESFRQLLSIEQQLIFDRSMLRYFRKHRAFLAYLGLLILCAPNLLFAFGEQFLQRWYEPKPVR